MEKTVIKTGATVDEAIEAALSELGCAHHVGICIPPTDFDELPFQNYHVSSLRDSLSPNLCLTGVHTPA